MDEVVARSTSRERFHMLLMSVFGGVSLLLAAIGIYGLMAYSVEQRTPEIGIRMALGAERSDVRRMIMRQGMTFAGIGLIVGLFGAFALAKQIASFLFGVTEWDPLVFGTIPVVLLATAILAVWWPASSHPGGSGNSLTAELMLCKPAQLRGWGGLAGAGGGAPAFPEGG
jgi:putative ABC transport system permease protein